MESFEYRGLWWLPAKSDDRISGILRFDPVEGANLELIGSFTPGFGKNLDYTSIIQGVTSDATKITLWECSVQSHGFSIKYGNSFTRSSYVPLYIFSGCHFAWPEDIEFESLSINYSNLEEWCDVNPFKVSDEDLPAKFAVSFERPDEIKAEVNKVSISIRHVLSSSGQNMHEASLKHTALVSLHPQTPLHFDTFNNDIVYDLRNFLSLGIGQAIYPQIIAGSVPEVDNEIRIFCATGQLTKVSKSRHPRYMLFSLSEISSNFEKILKTWFEKSKVLDPVFELYFGITYNSVVYPKVEFLLLAQAMEAYHRNIYNGFYLPTKEYKSVAKALKKAIPDNLSDEHTTNLQSRIDFGNEYTLFTRLKLILNEVLKPYRGQLDPLIGDFDKFARIVKATRNSLTHHNKDKNALTDLQEIYDYAQKMKVILQMCFLVEIGFSSEQISKFVSQNQFYQNLIVHR